jgi:cytochrome c peroxidase
VRFGIRTPNGALTQQELIDGNNNPAGGNGGLSQADINAGRALFFRAGCQTCHGGGKWTNSTKDFESPPAAGEIAKENDLTPPPGAGQPNPPPNPNQGTFLHRFLRDVGSYELNVPGSANQVGNGHPQIGAVEKDTANLDALGKDFDGDGKGAGFNIPSLLGIHAVQPYYHNGACETLVCVVGNVRHRTANFTQPDLLANPADVNRVVRFLETIGANTAPLP